MYTMSFVRLEAYPIGTMELDSLNFAVKRILFKIFCTNSNDIIQRVVNCTLILPDMSVVLTARKKKFLTKFSVSDNGSVCLIMAYALCSIQLH